MANVAEAVRSAAERLSAVSDTARLDAEWLMAHALGADRSAMLIHRQRDPVPGAFAALVERRLRREPLAYIVGRQEFMDLDLAVTPAVLIPRADSEAVVTAALEACPAPSRVLDCGTGSGALLLAVLAASEAEGVGIDRSAEALAVARANAGHNGLAGRTRFLHADWENGDWAEGLGRFDCILANPPYVETDAELDCDVAGHEPHGALFAGPEGLDAYRVLVPQLPGLLAERGIAVIEIGAAQDGAVARIAQASGFATELRRDLAGRPRALILREKREIGLGNGRGHG